MKRLGAAIAILGLMTAGAVAQNQSGGATAPGMAKSNQAYCLILGDGSKNCGFQTMAACDKAKTGSTDKCMRNADATTGSGSGMNRDMDRSNMNRGENPNDHSPSGTPGER